LIAVADSYKKPAGFSPKAFELFPKSLRAFLQMNAGFSSNACGLLQSQKEGITKVQPNPVKQITTANAKPEAFARQE
jgi:hypothetical protein